MTGFFLCILVFDLVCFLKVSTRLEKKILTFREKPYIESYIFREWGNDFNYLRYHVGNKKSIRWLSTSAKLFLGEWLITTKLQPKASFSSSSLFVNYSDGIMDRKNFC